MSTQVQPLEIEAKFLISSENFEKLLPQLVNFKLEERYYLFKTQSGVELRITKSTHKDGTTSATLDRLELVEEPNLPVGSVRKKDRLQISLPEFEQLKNLLQAQNPDTRPIVREHYELTYKNLVVQIKKYQKQFVGLIRAEFEFDSVADLQNFHTPSWCGVNITSTPIGLDCHLADLCSSEFQTLLNKLK